MGKLFGKLGDSSVVHIEYEGYHYLVDTGFANEADLSEEEMTAVDAEQRVELRRRSERFRGGREPILLAGRTAVIVDDGVATGATAKVACQVARAREVSRVGTITNP